MAQVGDGQLAERTVVILQRDPVDPARGVSCTRGRRSPARFVARPTPELRPPRRAASGIVAAA